MTSKKLALDVVGNTTEAESALVTHIHKVEALFTEQMFEKADIIVGHLPADGDR